MMKQSARIALPALLLVVGTAAGGAAQDEAPEGWQIRLDREGADATPSFVSMPPGWHITTGPAAIFYDSSRTASGLYRLEAEIFLFDPGDRREGFGILFGGSDLEGDSQSYTYFLIRRDGRFMVKKRDGSETSVLQDWTPHPAIVTWEARGEGEDTARNVLGAQIGASEVRFRVNGQDVATLSREGMATDGIVGLRVNHGLNLHVTRLEMEPAGHGEPGQ